MKDYQDLYLKCDVLLLADVFENVRNNILKNCGLFPSHYLSPLGLSWAETLTMTKFKLELIPDPDMLQKRIKKDTRGGISKISNRYSYVKSKHLKLYDPKQESKHIM